MRRATTACPTSTPPSSDCARRATSSTRTTPSGCARPTSATTRTGSSVAATASTPTSRPTPRYYLDKGDRGFEHKIYLLGADHHGYVHRLKALAGAAGDDPERDIEVLIGQLVSINGAKLSKRAGNIIELDDLQAWLGTDALRYTLGRYPADSPLTIDPEILQRRTNDNPVFYVQYAHARTSRGRPQRGIRRRRPLDVRARAARRTRPSRRCSARCRSSRASSRRRPSCASRTASPATSRSSRASTTAGTTTAACCPLGDEPIGDLHRTRLWLNDATGQVIRNGLDLLGVSAPERM